MNSSRTIFHIDMDAFFASVEQRDHPEWRGKPVIVGAEPGKRGVVCAASYEARKFGVHSAMPISEAQRRCPHGVFVKPNGDAYGKASQAIMDIFGTFSPNIEQISVDEAFLDMTGTGKLFGSPLETARKIKDRIKADQLLTASVGIAPNKLVAKIASDLNKPDGITLAPFDEAGIIEWLAPMNVGRIWGIGKKMQLVFESIGVITVGDLQQLSVEYLAQRFGKSGASLYYLCRGMDERPVCEGEMVKSISREHTFNVDSKSKEEWKKTLLVLSENVARRARRYGVKGGTVVLTWRRSDFSRHSRRVGLAFPTNVAKLIYDTAITLLDSLRESAMRLIGVGITSLDQEVQIDLFGEGESTNALEQTEKAVDQVIARFGSSIIAKGTELDIRKHEKRHQGIS